MSGKQLPCCRQVDILTCEAEDLVDLKEVRVTSDLPLSQRAEQFLEQVGNPYLFRVDNLIVRVSFSGNQALASKLAKIFAQ